jgi:hypothetical protein
MASLVLTGDTSGQVTIAAPAVAGTTTLTLPATTGTMLNDATVGVCRAWVNFNGTGTVAIRASFNVSSITDNGTGDYTVNFTTAMTDVNYAVNASAGTNTLTTPVQIGYFKPNFSPLSNGYVAPTTSAVRLGMINLSSYDVQHAYVSIFR